MRVRSILGTTLVAVLLAGGLGVAQQRALPADLPADPRDPALNQGPKAAARGQQVMVSTQLPIVTEAALKVLREGGNAVDAMVTAVFLQHVNDYHQVSHFGAMSALYFDAKTRTLHALNAVSERPRSDRGGRGDASKVAIGGVVRGLEALATRFGTRPWASYLAPAIESAEEGVVVTSYMYGVNYQKWETAEFMRSHEGARAFYMPEGHLVPVGARWKMPALAAHLRQVAAEGADYMYTGEWAKKFVAAATKAGGRVTAADLAEYRPHWDEPVRFTYRGHDIVGSPAPDTGGLVVGYNLNILENFDLKAMGYNSARYIHTVYQAMNLAYADRDFYYGDVYAPPEEPVAGLLSKAYARERAKLVDPRRNDAKAAPGDPYRFQGGANPYLDLLKRWHEPRRKGPSTGGTPMAANDAAFEAAFYAGTTSVIAADKEGWVVSVTPSGGWVPAVIAGEAGVGLSQRMQSFVTDPAENPFNVVGPGRQPRVTLTPSLALKDGRPWLAFAVQGGDGQDQDLLQYFLNIAEFGMTPQEAAEAPGFNSFQMRASFETHESRPGRIMMNDATPPWVRKELKAMGYDAVFRDRTSGPVNAILLDHRHGTFWGASSNHGEDYGIGW